MPEKDNAAVISIFGETCVRERGGDVSVGIAAWRNSGAGGEIGGGHGNKPTDAGTMAAMVGGRLHADVVLAVGSGAVGSTGGEEHIAAIAAGVFPKANAPGKNDRPAALHSSSDDNFRDSSNLKDGIFPQKTPIALNAPS